MVVSNTLRIQVCPNKGMSPTILLWGWDLDHQSYSREGSGFLGMVFVFISICCKLPCEPFFLMDGLTN